MSSAYSFSPAGTPSTAHEKEHHGAGLAAGLAAFAAATILAGTYLTRRRLRRRSHPV